MNDHYIDIDGIGHVHLKQTVHPIDIDNADFKVNVSARHIDATTNEEIHGVVEYVSDFARFEVFPWGLNDSTEGDGKVLTDPWRLDASPFTWMKNGLTKYTITRVNNAVAQDDPDGGDEWTFNIPFR